MLVNNKFNSSRTDGCQPLHMCRADAVCTLTRWQHFSARNDVIAAIYLESVTLNRTRDCQAAHVSSPEM